ncbi:DUF4199 domain-containing protein [Fulvivirga sedimenti]|uniref:DUF4199 domain-containing protein n=1 Tax=Fulvivirga sedimenti TaxID=2879465 RepID=A0A9X1KZ48_9BACT|nr:DUF4199 domain-containing protein [Fulvivirga sedimenti]MCA6078543.1 DUF4199 domain-containing protein [Fulvivirga sedimenti]
MKNIRIEIKWGIIFTIVMMLWTLLERLLGWHDVHIDKHAYYTLIFILPAFIMYYFALVEKRETDYAGQMNWSQGFRSGIIIGIVVALLSPLSQYITQTFISPHYFDNVIEYSVKSGTYETTEAAAEYFNLTNYIVQSMIFAVVTGAFTAAIVAIFTKKKYAN